MAIDRQLTEGAKIGGHWIRRGSRDEAQFSDKEWLRERMGTPRNEQVFARGAICFKCDDAPLCMLVIGVKSPLHSRPGSERNRLFSSTTLREGGSQEG